MHDEIVDAHGDKVDADRRMPARIDGDLELRADAVVRRDEDRIAKTGAFQIEQAAEAAEIHVGSGPARRFGERLDRSNQRIPGIDVDTGAGIRDRLR